MKFFFRVLFAPLIWLIQACNPLGKPIDLKISDSHYYNRSKTDIIYSPMGNWFELGKTPLNADVESFQVLNRNMGKDNQHAYYESLKIDYPDIDLASFHAETDVLMWNVGLNKNHVYVFETGFKDEGRHVIVKIVEQADPNTFKMADVDWAKDGTTHFYRYNPIDVDYLTFELLNTSFATDKDNVYLFHLERFETIDVERESFQQVNDLYAKDSNHIYFFLDYLRQKEIGELIALPYSNFEQVKFYDSNHVLIEDRLYYMGQLVEGINTNELEVLSEVYVKDKNHVYYEGILVKGADAASFHYDESIYSYRDKNHTYRGSEIWRKDNVQMDTESR